MYIIWGENSFIAHIKYFFFLATSVHPPWKKSPQIQYFNRRDDYDGKQILQTSWPRLIFTELISMSQRIKYLTIRLKTLGYIHSVLISISLIRAFCTCNFSVLIFSCTIINLYNTIPDLYNIQFELFSNHFCNWSVISQLKLLLGQMPNIGAKPTEYKYMIPSDQMKTHSLIIFTKWDLISWTTYIFFYTRHESFYHLTVWKDLDSKTY